MAEITIDKTVVYYDITVESAGRIKSGTQYRVRDDGWALFVKTRDNRPVGRVSFGTDSKRVPELQSALDALRGWLDGDMAGV